MLENLDKYIFIYDKLKDIDGNKNLSVTSKYEFSIMIPYCIREFKIKDFVFKKSFIIDMRNMSDYIVSLIFNNFEHFQQVFCSKYFFSDFLEEFFNYKYNMELIFVYDENRNYDINTYSVIYDLNYMLKKFMTGDEIIDYLTKSYNGAFDNLELKLKNRNLELKNLNYVYGLNGSGKTPLLMKLSSILSVPIFNMDDNSLNLLAFINDKESVRKYLYMLTGSYNVNEYSSYERYVHMMSQILEFSRENNNILLLDNLRWGSLDNLSKLRLVDTLFEYSLSGNNVIFTGCDDNVKGLVKIRTYNSNIIDL